ncbi:type VI secretion system tip protein VgrG, partial [Escherichia coli]
ADFDAPGPQSISAAMNDWTNSPFDEGFQLLDEATGKPLAQYRYELIRQDGTVISGVTGHDGHLSQQCSEIAEALELRILGCAF